MPSLFSNFHSENIYKELILNLFMVTTRGRVPARGKTKKKVKKHASRSKTTSVNTGVDEKLVRNLIARDEVLVDNFVGLQKAMVNVSVKFGELTERIDKLLDIYQKAADIFVQKQITESDRQDNLTRKVDVVMEQNKVLSRRPTAPMPPRNPVPSASRSSMPPVQSAPAVSAPVAAPSNIGSPSITQGEVGVPAPGMIPPAPSMDATRPKPLPRI